MDIIKVAGSSRTSAVAGAIAGVFREYQRAEVQAIGAGAVNQAVKALVLAASYLEKDGFNIAFQPQFSDVEIDGKVRTAIKMVVIEIPNGFHEDDFEIETAETEPIEVEEVYND